MASPETMLDDAGKKKCMTCLPLEMIELVLVRLPVSTLLRCRSVCKQWNGFIQDPQFIMEHLQRAPRCPLLFSRRESCSNKLYPSEVILFDEAWSPSRWNAPVVGPDDFLCASCNGLVLLYSDRSTIKIANLATGECIHLAKPSKKLKGDSYRFYSFGYHPVTKQYKVIHFLGRHQVPAGSASDIQVYTLGDYNWRNVRAPRAQRFDYIEYSRGVNVEGAMYWLTGDNKSNWGRSVLAFDLNEERFRTIQLPASDRSRRSIHSQITEVHGKVSFVARSKPDAELQMWTLHSKVNQSWSQKYSIPFPPIDTYVPGPYPIHGDKIVMYDKFSNWWYHELMGQSIDQRNMVELLNCSPRLSFNTQLYMHVQSLVRLDAYKRTGIFLRPKRLDVWQLKKWEGWMQDLCRLEELWRRIYMSARSISEQAHAMGMNISLQLEHPPIKGLLNWVEQKRVKEMLEASRTKLNGILEAMEAWSRAGDGSQSEKTINKAVKGESSSTCGQC